MPRLIDADALKKEAERLIRCEVEDGRERFYRINAVEVAAINVAPTIDAVPVVRCKDCVEYIPWLDGKICARIGSYFGNTKPTDFCSYGKRRCDNE